MGNLITIMNWHKGHEVELIHSDNIIHVYEKDDFVEILYKRGSENITIKTPQSMADIFQMSNPMGSIESDEVKNLLKGLRERGIIEKPKLNKTTREVTFESDNEPHLIFL